MSAQLAVQKRNVAVLLGGVAVIAALLAVQWGCQPSKDGGPQAALPSSATYAQATSALKQMCDTLEGAKAFSCEIRASMDERGGLGQLIEVRRLSRVVAVRPDRLYVRTASGPVRWTAWYKGNALAMLDAETNLYAVEKVPGTIHQMLDHLAERYDLVMPAADLVGQDLYNTFTANVRDGVDLGVHKVNGRECRHLLFRQDDIDWQIWIDAGEKPLPRKLVITYKHEPGHPQYEATIDDWNLDPKIPADLFDFVPPADAMQVSMADLLSEREGENP